MKQNNAFISGGSIFDRHFCLEGFPVASYRLVLPIIGTALLALYTKRLGDRGFRPGGPESDVLYFGGHCILSVAG